MALTPEEETKAIAALQPSPTAKQIFEKGRAGYPAIYLVTAEDNRSQREIKLASRALDRKLYIWSEMAGLVEDKKAAGPIDDTEQPVGVLEAMKKLEKGTVVILRLFHHYLKDPLVQVKLLDLMPIFKINRNMLIITSPTIFLPPEVEKEFTIIESKLPNTDQIKDYIEGIVKGAKLPAEFIPDDEKRLLLAKSALGLTTSEAESALTLSIIRPRLAGDPNIWDPKIVLEEKCLALKKTGLLEYIPAPKNGLDEVGGLENLKEWVRMRKGAFSDAAKAFGLTPPKGALTLGPPGTGKSLTAKAISGEFNLPLLRLDMGKMYGALIGSSEGNIRRAIEIAEALAPCVMWIDEIEKGVQGTKNGGDNGVGARVLGTLLTWMSDKTSQVFVYATANDISSMPPELLRKGRFDEIFFVDLPGEEERRDILRIHLSRLGRAKLIGKTINVDELAAEYTKEFTGSEIKAGIDAALFAAFKALEGGAKNRDLSHLDLVGAFQDTNPLSKTMKESIATTRTWCEGRTRHANKRPEDTEERIDDVRRAMQV